MTTYELNYITMLENGQLGTLTHCYGTLALFTIAGLVYRSSIP